MLSLNATANYVKRTNVNATQQHHHGPWSNQIKDVDVCTDGANNAGKPLPCGPAEDVEAAIEVDDGRGPDRAALLTGQSGLGKDFLGILI